MYEHRSMPLLPLPRFRRRVARHSAIALSLTAAALFVGILGYHMLGGLSWIDALLEASMILGGMGPIQAPHNDAAKVFASFYALFSGLAFIGIAGIVIAPIAHRLLHKFHLEDTGEGKE